MSVMRHKTKYCVTVQDCWTLDLAGQGCNKPPQDLELHENHEAIVFVVTMSVSMLTTYTLQITRVIHQDSFLTVLTNTTRFHPRSHYNCRN